MPAAGEGVFNESFTQGTASNWFQRSRVEDSVPLTGEPEEDEGTDALGSFFLNLHATRCSEGGQVSCTLAHAQRHPAVPLTPAITRRV